MFFGRPARLAGAIACAAALALPWAGPAQALSVNDPALNRQWALAKIGAPKAWDTATGKGSVIAVIDSGIDLTHEDLATKIVPGRDYTGKGSVQDDCGHGSHVSGTAAATTNNARGVAGVAPDARILPIKVLQPDGNDCVGNSDDIDDAIRWAADQGATVINLSLGSDIQFLGLSGFGDSLRYAWGKGSIPVVAAGNQFLLGSGYQDEPAIIVTATARNDSKSSYSSGTGGAKWAMSAPGGDGGGDDLILSTYFVPNKTNSYGLLAGTSMATPHVAGAAAVLRSMGLTPQQTVDRLLGTSLDLGAKGPDTTFGAGRLDLAKAVGAGGGTVAPTTPTTLRPPSGGGAGPTTSTTRPRSGASTSGGTRPAPGGATATTPDGSSSGVPSTIGAIGAGPLDASPIGEASPPPTIALELEGDDAGRGASSKRPPGPLVALAALGVLGSIGGTAWTARSWRSRGSV